MQIDRVDKNLNLEIVLFLAVCIFSPQAYLFELYNWNKILLLFEEKS